MHQPPIPQIPVPQIPVPQIHGVDTLDLRLLDTPLPYAQGREAAITAGFARARGANPHLFNGGFFLWRDVVTEAGQFTARAHATDYATFLHWRQDGWPDVGHHHIFPVGAVITSDNHLLVGEMGRTTTNAARLYPPSGSFDPHDLTPDRRIDPLANIWREITEEAGLDARPWPRRPGWLVITDGPRIALVTLIDAPLAADPLAARIRAFLARETDPELGDVALIPVGTHLPPDRTVGYVNPLLAFLAQPAPDHAKAPDLMV